MKNMIFKPLTLMLREYISRQRLEIGRMSGHEQVAAAIALNKIIEPDAQYASVDLTSTELHVGIPAKGNAAEILLEHTDILNEVAHGKKEWDDAYDQIIGRRGYEPSARLTAKVMKLALVCMQHANSILVTELLTMARDQMQLKQAAPKTRRVRASKAPQIEIIEVEHVHPEPAHDEVPAETLEEAIKRTKVEAAKRLASGKVAGNTIIIVDVGPKDPTEGQHFSNKAKIFIPNDMEVEWHKLPFTSKKLEDLCQRIADGTTTRGDDFKDYRDNVIWQAKLTNKYRVIFGRLKTGEFVALAIKPREEMNHVESVVKSMNKAVDKYGKLYGRIFGNPTEPPQPK